MMEKILKTMAVLALAFIYAGAGHAAETEFDRIKMLAEHGMPMSQYVLGMMYETGEGAPKNLFAAELWYQKAADGGITMAESRLRGFMERRRNYAEFPEGLMLNHLGDEQREALREMDEALQRPAIAWPNPIGPIGYDTQAHKGRDSFEPGIVETTLRIILMPYMIF